MSDTSVTEEFVKPGEKSGSVLGGGRLSWLEPP